MRVTQSMLSNNMLRNLSKSYDNMGTYMDQLNTGKKINRPSDDPVVAVKGMDYRSQLLQVEQYQRNTNEVHNWMDNTDDALDQATKALQRIRELAVQASNDTYDDSERKNIKEEIEQLKEHLVDIANTNVNGKYIFNGTNTDVQPITKPITDETGNIDPEKLKIDSSPVNIEVSKGIELKANVDATGIFGETSFVNIQQLIKDLDDGNQEGIEASLAAIDDNIDNVLNARADLGARMNRLDLIENRLGSQEISATQMMSKNEDIDYEEVITQLITQESIHRAALSTGSRIIQPTLVDFLR
ncbi:flagellar hook-associated protein FlgL [Ornithinibacillus californiensis]|uniref:flagellar hook-associated protein FlgL n=1 Tax=Ornithinibacillus californiensis TaxID=161536 RepID=UPI00064D810F|nr:flagellar hook-associated protein FlgL [Ornithinibacillus californiensis]